MSFADRFAQIKQQAGDVDTSYEEKGTISSGKKFNIDEDGIYTVIVESAIFKESQSSGSAWYDITFKTEDDMKCQTKLFVLNRDGLPYNINDKGIKKSTFGWNKMASLNYILNGEWDGLPVPEEIEIEVYDKEANGRIAKLMPCAKSIMGKPLDIGVKMVLADVRIFLDAVSGQSSTEKRNGSPAQVKEDFIKSITEKPEPIDKRDKSKGNGTVASSKNDAPFDTDKKSFGFSK